MEALTVREAITTMNLLAMWLERQKEPLRLDLDDGTMLGLDPRITAQVVRLLTTTSGTA